MNGARYAYLKRLCNNAAENRNIYIVSADYAAPVFDDFKRDYPKQYISVGIAEQNLIAVSCGLAMAGKYAVAYGLSPFPVLRAYDQIKCALSNMSLPVNIAVAGTGYSEYGVTHSNTEDISLMRTIPNMRIITPTDNIMGEVAADYSLINNIPIYIRFDKNSEGCIYSERNVDFNKGFEVLREGNDVVVITCGWFTIRILELAKHWACEGINARIIDLYSLPYDYKALFESISNLPIITVEDHIIQGGIGSALIETLNRENININITRMGIDYERAYPHVSGDKEYFNKLFGLSDEDITRTVRRVIQGKSE